MNVGYARVSTRDQDLSLQLDALEKAGCEKVFQEKLSGTDSGRPELRAMMSQLRKNDVIVVWKLDRLARSLKDLVSLVNEMNEKGVELNSLHDHIDTSTAQGKFTFHLFAAMAEFERDIISERTKAGLAAARARGRTGGGLKDSPKKRSTPPSSLKNCIRKENCRSRTSANNWRSPEGLSTTTCATEALR